MTVRPRGRKHEADVRDANGKRHRYAFPNQWEAERWEAQAKLDVVMGKVPTPPLADKREVLTLEGALAGVIEAEWHKAKSRRHLEFNARCAIDHFGPKRLCRLINFSEVEDYIGALKRKGQTGGTINRKLAALSKLLHYARKHDPTFIPPVMPRQKEGKPRERTLSKEEVEALVAWDGWKGQEAVLTVFLADTGCRLSEALNLLARDVNLAQGEVTFRDTKNPNGKYGQRSVPLSPRLRDALVFAKDRDRVFEVAEWTYRRRFEDAVMDLDLGKGVSIHTLRHTLASRFGRAGVNGFQLMRWFGWTSPQTADRYVKIDMAALNSMMEMVA